MSTSTSLDTASSSKQPGMTIQYPLLTDTNYVAWKTKMRVFMIAQGVWDALENEEVDERKDKMALTAIYQGVSEETLLMISDMGTAKEAWAALKAMHMGAERVQRAKVQTLKSELERMRMKEKESVDDFSTRLVILISKMRLLGEKIEETKIVEKTLRAVSTKLLPIATTIEQFGNIKKMTSQEVFGRLKMYEERLKGYDEAGDEQLMFSHANRKDWQGRCRARWARCSTRWGYRENESPR